GQLSGIERIALTVANLIVTLATQTEGFQLSGFAGGASTMSGGAGNDTIRGGSGADVINAAGGLNLVEGAGKGTDQVTHDAGSATVSILVTGSDSVTLLASQPGASVRVGPAVNAMVNASRSSAAVTITGDSGADSIVGGSGADSLLGGAGTDTIKGGPGADTFLGGTGIDRFVFAAGDSGQDSLFDVIKDYKAGASGVGDVIDYGLPMKATAKSAPGVVVNDRGIVSFTSPPSNLSDALSVVAGLVVGAGEFALFQSPNSEDTYLFVADGVSGKSVGDVVVMLQGLKKATRGVVDSNGDLNILSALYLEGSEGSDTLVGEEGDDTLTGNGGADSLIGHAGADSILGGSGNDTLVGGEEDLLLDGGDGSDVLQLLASFQDKDDAQLVNVEAVTLALNGLRVSLGTQTESLTITGFAAGASNIIAGFGNDSITGGSLEDSLAGGAGNDRLDGGAGDDSITGGAGNDSITAGAGNDTIVGAD
ncbi:MAG: calcium-binding protein, partial [Betaproteobacteria bacterium]|nr:calcium-binding protein [Betaproteobacteria bacterium]